MDSDTEITAVIRQPVSNPDAMDETIAELQRKLEGHMLIDVHDRDGFVVVMLTGDPYDVKHIVLNSFTEMPVVYI